MKTDFPNASAVLQHVAALAKQERFAAIGALTDTAFEIRGAVQQAMKEVFEGPTPFVLSGVEVVKPQELESLSALTQAEGLGGGLNAGTLTALVRIDPYGRGKGPSPEDVLTAEVYGGSRGLKGAERRLQAVGLMPGGYFMLPSRELLADASKVDAYGNIRGPFIRSLLSYLQAFNGDGFKANAKPRTLARLARRGRTGDKGPERSGSVGAPTINGVVYFVSRGPGGGERIGAGSKRSRMQHLPAGIWGKSGIHGSNVRPVFLFVPTVNYRIRLRFDEIARNVAERTFGPRFQARFERALATAR